jgi:hypothetical protein
MFYHSLFSALDKAKIHYAVVGGLAVALHGVLRGTVDVDIVIHWDLNNLIRLEKALKNLGLVSTLPLTAENVFLFKDEYIQNRNMIAWNFHDPKNPLNQVDLVITFDLKKEDIETIRTRNGPIKVLSRKKLIAMKKKSGRPQDLEDVKALESL